MTDTPTDQELVEMVARAIFYELDIGADSNWDIQTDTLKAYHRSAAIRSISLITKREREKVLGELIRLAGPPFVRRIKDLARERYGLEL